MSPNGTAQRQRPENGACSVSSASIAPGVSCVRVAGELDPHTTVLLMQGLTAALQEESPSLVVDLADCAFIDSTALDALIEADARLRRMGRRLALVAPGSEVRRTLELTGLDRVLAVHDSPATAIAP